jgi:hypothetical protein
MFPAAASAASIFRSTASTVPARGVPGASNFERGVCVGRALPALARRGLEGALLVVDVDALGMSPPNVSLVGDDGVSRLLFGAARVGIECLAAPGDVPRRDVAMPWRDVLAGDTVVVVVVVPVVAAVVEALG